jgi:hypothetical protein
VNHRSISCATFHDRTATSHGERELQIGAHPLAECGEDALYVTSLTGAVSY